MRVTSSCLMAVAFVLANGCSTSQSSTRSVVEIPVHCAANEVASECLRMVSELCGADGYELLDSKGNPLSVADLRNHIATARCNA